jgi:hypothetical protein
MLTNTLPNTISQWREFEGTELTFHIAYNLELGGSINSKLAGNMLIFKLKNVKCYSFWFGKRRRFGQDLSQTLGI